MIAHQQSHLYPCQLALHRSTATAAPQFIFTSPLNSYSTIFSTSNSQCDLIPHQGIRYKNLNAIQLDTGQRLAILSNPQTINCVKDSKINNLIKIDPCQHIISDVIGLNSSTYIQSAKHFNGSFSFAYLSFDDIDPENMFLNIKRLHEINNWESAKGIKLNPESESLIETQIDQSQTNKISSESGFNEFSQSRMKISCLAPLSTYSSQTFQIKAHPFASNLLSLFDKRTSTLYTYDSQYQSVTNIISTISDQENQFKTNFQSNKITFLSQKIILNSSCSGTIKLIDTRMSRVVHVRNLMEQVGRQEEIPNQRNQNVIKFWNEQNNGTNDNFVDQRIQFLINLHNKIYQVDLRSNGLSKQDAIFRFEYSDQITNYEIVEQKNERFVGITTESHSKFKAYVVNEKKNFDSE